MKKSEGSFECLLKIEGDDHSLETKVKVSKAKGFVEILGTGELIDTEAEFLCDECEKKRLQSKDANEVLTGIFDVIDDVSDEGRLVFLEHELGKQDEEEDDKKQAFSDELKNCEGFWDEDEDEFVKFKKTFNDQKAKSECLLDSYFALEDSDDEMEQEAFFHETFKKPLWEQVRLGKYSDSSPILQEILSEDGPLSAKLSAGFMHDYLNNWRPQFDQLDQFYAFNPELGNLAKVNLLNSGAGHTILTRMAMLKNTSTTGYNVNTGMDYHNLNMGLDNLLSQSAAFSTQGSNIFKPQFINSQNTLGNVNQSYPEHLTIHVHQQDGASSTTTSTPDLINFEELSKTLGL